jgi:ABC-2 type transport system ATP-binding protein
VKTRLEIAAVAKVYGKHQVLDHAWLQVRSGEAVGLLGANGAGKTTMLRIAAGLVRADSGSVRWLPVTPERAASISYFGGETTLPPHVSARRWASLFGVVTAERRPIGRLSRGSRQALGLRVLLAGPPADLVVLDEPWDGLDPAATKWLTDTLRQRTRAGAAILISSHRLHDLDAVCTRFVMLENGKCSALNERDERPRLEVIEQAFMGLGPPASRRER